MTSSIAPKVRLCRAPKVTRPVSTLPVVKNEVTAAFAARLAQLCDEKGLPVRGRQTLLGKAMQVTPNAARKWLVGEGLPELDMAVRLAKWGGVDVLWLLQGNGPKRTPFDVKALVLDEALHALPKDAAHQALEYLRYTLERSMPPTAKEQVARYSVMIDAMLHDIDKTPA